MTHAALSELPDSIKEASSRPFKTAEDGDLMIWSEKFSVGVHAIDDQHHEIFDSLNDLQTAVIDHHDREVISSLLSQVAEGTRAHFASEEAMMAKSKYNGMALHALKHQRLLEQLDAFVARFNRGFELNEHSLIFMRDWFIPHILEADANFGLWYYEHCLS